MRVNVYAEEITPEVQIVSKGETAQKAARKVVAENIELLNAGIQHARNRKD